MRDLVESFVFMAFLAILVFAYPVRATWVSMEAQVKSFDAIGNFTSMGPCTPSAAKTAFASYATVDDATWTALVNAVRPSWRSHGDVRMAANRMDAEVPGLDAPLPPHESLPFSAAVAAPVVFSRPWMPAAPSALTTASMAAPPAPALPEHPAFAAAKALAHDRAAMLSLDAFCSLAEDDHDEFSASWKRNALR